jgi:hypothetical protein
VNYFADPILTFKSGAATLTQLDPGHYVLDFGTLDNMQAAVSASFDVENVLHDAVFQDALGGTFDVAGVNDFSLTDFPAANMFSGIEPGSSLDPGIGFDPNKPNGIYTNVIFLNPNSENTSSTTSLNAIQLDLTAQVVPEPASWVLMLGGVGVLIAWQRMRSRRSV